MTPKQVTPKTRQGTADFCLRAGAGKVEITNQEPGVAVADPFFVRALVLDDGTTRALVLALDVTAIGGREISDGMLPDIGEDFLPALRRRLQDECRISAGNILINASHTHPPGRMLCNDQEQLERTVQAVQQAVTNLEPVRTGAGTGKEERIAMNRTLRLRNGRQWTIRHSNPSPPPDQVSGSGPLDTSLGVLRVDRLDGTPLALLFNFACHPLFGNYDGRLTANFPGHAARIIEEQLGHGAIALFIQGAAGDVCDLTFKDFDRPRNVAVLGEYLAESALQTRAGIQTTAAGLKMITREMLLPRRTDIEQRLELLRQEQRTLLASLRFTTLNWESFLSLCQRYGCPGLVPALQGERRPAQAETSPESADRQAFDSRNMEKYVRNIRAMETLARIEDDMATLAKHAAINARAGNAMVAAELVALNIGDCLLLGVPFEALTQIGLKIKQMSPFAHTFVAAYSNGYLHYGAPAEDYDKGGYEVTECLLAPEWQDEFEKNTRQIFQSLLDSQCTCG